MRDRFPAEAFCALSLGHALPLAALHSYGEEVRHPPHEEEHCRRVPDTHGLLRERSKSLGRGYHSEKSDFESFFLCSSCVSKAMLRDPKGVPWTPGPQRRL